MATFKQTMKACLLGYPTIFPNPKDVCVHLFAVIGNGYDWYNGELVDVHDDEYLSRSEMKYPKPRDKEDLTDEYAKLTGSALRDGARLVCMKYVAEHIDEIVDSDPVLDLFGNGSDSYVTKYISTEYASGLHFPDDIKEDWAKALYKFLNWWLVQLNSEYGVDQKDLHNISFWPQNVQDAHAAIIAARRRLHPLAYNGQTIEEHSKRMKELIGDLFNKEPEIKS